MFTSTSWWSSATTALKPINKELRAVGDLVGNIWPSGERQPANQKPIETHDIAFAGETVNAKLGRVTTEMQRVGATTAVISALDEVAWLFNLRGADIPYNAFFKSYAIIHTDYQVSRPELFVNLPQLSQALYPPGVRVFDYSTFWSRLNETAMNPAVTKVWASPRLSQAIFNIIPPSKLMLPLTNSAVQRVKSRKNEVERRGMRACQIRDAVVRMKHIGWLEQQLNEGKTVNETQSSDQLLVFQSQQNYFKFPSFAAISAAGDRAAVIHYRAEPATARQINKTAVYLLDVRAHRRA